MESYKVSAIALSIFFVLIIAAQFFLTKDIRHDNLVSKDLESIENSFYEVSPDSAWQKGEVNIADLDIGDNIKIRAKDNNYEVNILSVSKDEEMLVLELCADFRRDTSSYSSASDYDFSKHSQGKSCFEREIYSPVMPVR
ncbi:MAG: hypothetical protein WDZ42_00870 [Candidatus Saccharimonadales bacterium]